MSTRWFVSTDMIGKPGSPKVAGPFTTRDDAFEARTAMEKLYGNYSVFEEEAKEWHGVQLGWITGKTKRRLATVVHVLSQDRYVIYGANEQGQPIGGDLPNLNNFTPATAVPTSAVERLRHQRETRNLTNADVDIFLAAVDEATA